MFGRNKNGVGNGNSNASGNSKGAEGGARGGKTPWDELTEYGQEVDGHGALAEKMDDAVEKERREKILSNRKAFEQDKKDCEEKEEALYEKSIHTSGPRNHDLDQAIGENRRALKLREAEFYREQAPLLIQDGEKRERFLKMINECAESRHGFHPDERAVEECLEVVGVGGDVSDACKYIKENAEAGDYSGLGDANGAYVLIGEIIEYADWGQDLADRVGYVELDFENGSPEENDEKVREIFEKL